MEVPWAPLRTTGVKENFAEQFERKGVKHSANTLMILISFCVNFDLKINGIN